MANANFLVRPERGHDVMEALTAALAERGVGHAWIAGRGTLDEVVLSQEGTGPRTFATTCRIVSFDGLASAGQGAGSIALAATIARPSPRGLELAAGDVIRAVAGDLQLLVTAFDVEGAAEEIPAIEGDDGAPDDDVPEASPPASSRPARPASNAWAALAAASDEAHAKPPPAPPPKKLGATPMRKPAAPSPALPPPIAPVAPRRAVTLDDVYPEAGDLLDHFAFGPCVVVRSDGEEMLVQNPTSGRTRTLKLSALEVKGPFEEGGKRLFKLGQKR